MKRMTSVAQRLGEADSGRAVQVVVADAELLPLIGSTQPLLPFEVELLTSDEWSISRSELSNRRRIMLVDADAISASLLDTDLPCIVTSSEERIPRHILSLRRMEFVAKPATPSSIATAITRLLQRLDEPPAREVLRCGNALLFIAPLEIDWVESEGNYLRLHIGEKRPLVRETLTRFLGRHLGRFIRIQRSVAVNSERIFELSAQRRDGYVVLRDGTRLPLSAAFRNDVELMS